MQNNYVYDLETYPNCFTAVFVAPDFPIPIAFEISEFKDESQQLFKFLTQRPGIAKLIGFNNLSFDYPLLHMFLLRKGKVTCAELYEKAQSLIEAWEDDARPFNQIKASEVLIPQIDLFKIHHFDNNARSTSLKKLEFAMRSDSIKDLPFPVGTRLNENQIRLLLDYNLHDVFETLKFYQISLSMIDYRKSLTSKYGKDFMNHNDAKIGKDYFSMSLEKMGVPCFENRGGGKKPRQTIRKQIVLKDAILPDIQFANSELERVKNWLSAQVITETKGVFEKLTAELNGFTLVFGAGGIHGSVSNTVAHSTPDSQIVDIDVKSYYPNLAIANGFYPEHLGVKFCAIYKDLFEMRSKHAKGSLENDTLKLALNGVYGDSNNKYSCFYDPLYTMKITINGQLLICKLIENLMDAGLTVLQANTDGVTVQVPKALGSAMDEVLTEWQRATKLTLERSNYKRMFIRDVNNYLAEYEGGRVKRKGAYEYDIEWHKDHSELVVPKVTEQVLLHDVNIRETVAAWVDVYDFFIFIRVPMTWQLEASGKIVQNSCRFLVVRQGVELTKLAPPLKGKTETRRIGVRKGRQVLIINDISELPKNWKDIIDYDYYTSEVEKLTMGLK